MIKANCHHINGSFFVMGKHDKEYFRLGFRYFIEDPRQRPYQPLLSSSQGNQSYDSLQIFRYYKRPLSWYGIDSGPWHNQFMPLSSMKVVCLSALEESKQLLVKRSRSYFA